MICQRPLLAPHTHSRFPLFRRLTSATISSPVARRSQNALTTMGVNIKRVSAFSTRHGIAIDTFDVDDVFNDESANVLKARISQFLRDSSEQNTGSAEGSMSHFATMFPESYKQSMSLEDRRTHYDLYRRYMQHKLKSSGDISESVQVSWHMGRKKATMYILYEDVIGSLGTITNVMSEFSIKIQNLIAYSSSSGVAVDTLTLSPNFTPTVGRALKARLLAELAARERQIATGSAELINLMPDHYLGSTTPAERLAHLELYRIYEQSKAEESVQISWSVKKDADEGAAARSASPRSVVLHLVFADSKGSLAVITGALLEAGVGILRASIFCTTLGVAVDTFELSSFSNATAEMIKARLTSHVNVGWMENLARTLTGQGRRGLTSTSHSRSTSPTQRVSPSHSRHTSPSHSRHMSPSHSRLGSFKRNSPLTFPPRHTAAPSLPLSTRSTASHELSALSTSQLWRDSPPDCRCPPATSVFGRAGADSGRKRQLARQTWETWHQEQDQMSA